MDALLTASLKNLFILLNKHMIGLQENVNESKIWSLFGGRRSEPKVFVTMQMN